MSVFVRIVSLYSEILTQEALVSYKHEGCLIEFFFPRQILYLECGTCFASIDLRHGNFAIYKGSYLFLPPPPTFLSIILVEATRKNSLYVNCRGF
jgi:hypothetical protein